MCTHETLSRDNGCFLIQKLHICSNVCMLSFLACLYFDRYARMYVCFTGSSTRYVSECIYIYMYMCIRMNMHKYVYLFKYARSTYVPVRRLAAELVLGTLVAFCCAHTPFTLWQILCLSCFVFVCLQLCIPPTLLYTAWHPDTCAPIAMHVYSTVYCLAPWHGYTAQLTGKSDSVTLRLHDCWCVGTHLYIGMQQPCLQFIVGRGSCLLVGISGAW